MKVEETLEDAMRSETRHEPDTTVEEDIDWRESIAAGMRIQNPMLGLHLQTFPYDSGYSGIEDPLNNDYSPLDFAGSGSQEESAFIRGQIDQERQDRDTLQRSGGLQGAISGIAGAATNPLYYIGGYAAGKSVSKFIVAELLIEGLSEGALQVQQYERTKAESAINLLSAGAGGAVLGPIAKYMSKGERQLVDDSFARLMKEETDVPDFAQGGSVGAAMPETTLEQETMVGGKAIETLAVGPMARLLTAKSVKARRLAQQIGDNPYMLKKHGEGEGVPSLEALQGEYEGIHASVLTDLETNYKSYRKAGGKMKFVEFDEEVGKALYNNDFHQDPWIKKTAQYQRSQYDEITGRAQAVGLMPEDLEPFYAASYRPRLYDYGKLSKDLPWLRKKVINSVMEGIKSKALVIVRIGNDKAAIRRSSYERIKGNPAVSLVETSKLNKADMAREAEGVSIELIDNLYNQTKVDPQIEGLMRSAGMLKERSLPIFDNELSRVLENRSSRVFGKYARDMGYEISSFEEFGTRSLSDEIEAVGREYSKLIAAAKTGKERASLQKESQAMQQDLYDMRDVVAGQYGRPVRALPLHNAAAALRLLNALSMLGGMTISAIPDLARPLFRYGLKAYAKGIYRLATGTANLSKADRIRLGIAIERLTNKRMSAITDIGNHDASWIRSTGDAFANLTLMTRWNDALKSLTAEIGAETMAGWIKTGTKKKLLGRAGLSSRIQESIAAEIKRTGSVNPLDWADIEARQHFGAALRSEVNSLIVTPGAAEIPLLMRDPVGKTMFQFKSFLFSSHAKVLLQGMQQADANAAVGALFMIGLGGITTAIKDGVRGKDLDDKGMMDWVLDSTDRSGMFGLTMLPINAIRQLAGNTPSRKISQGAVSNVLGPTPQTLTDLLDSAFKLAEGDDPNFDYLVRHVPMQSLLHWRGLLATMGSDIALTEREKRWRE